jgi:hypothetical protein
VPTRPTPLAGTAAGHSDKNGQARFRRRICRSISELPEPTELPETTEQPGAEPTQPDVTFFAESGDRLGYLWERRAWVDATGREVASFGNFRKIAHRLLALTYGLAGGIVAIVFRRWRAAL